MLAPLLALSMALAPDHSGGKLYVQCLAEVRLIDSPPSRQEQIDFVPGVACLAYIDGFTDGVNLIKEQICIGGADLGTLARVYVEYLKKNPTLMDQPKNLALTLALENNYPCSKKK